MTILSRRWPILRTMSTPDADVLSLREAIKQASQAEKEGNLPIGAVIILEGLLIASGRNSIWSPSLRLDCHAEMEALRNVPVDLRGRFSEMTLYTTLEPCLMCAGAILLHRIGRVVFGASDGHGGATTSFGSMPPFFQDALLETRWIGPSLPDECDRLARRVTELEAGRNGWQEDPIHG